MNELEIIKEQVKALERLLELKNQIIEQLEKKNVLISPATSGNITISNCSHQWPTNYYGTPYCIKCGQRLDGITYTTVSNTTSDNKSWATQSF